MKNILLWSLPFTGSVWTLPPRTYMQSIQQFVEHARLSRTPTRTISPPFHRKALRRVNTTDINRHFSLALTPPWNAYPFTQTQTKRRNVDYARNSCVRLCARKPMRYILCVWCVPLARKRTRFSIIHACHVFVHIGNISLLSIPHPPPARFPLPDSFTCVCVCVAAANSPNVLRLFLARGQNTLNGRKYHYTNRVLGFSSSPSPSRAIHSARQRLCCFSKTEHSHMHAPKLAQTWWENHSTT